MALNFHILILTLNQKFNQKALRSQLEYIENTHAKTIYKDEKKYGRIYLWSWFEFYIYFDLHLILTYCQCLS